MKQVILRTNLKHWRDRKALNIRQLAEMAEVSSATIVKIEKDPYHLPRPNVSQRLAKALGIAIADLIIEDDQPSNSQPAA